MSRLVDTESRVLLLHVSDTPTVWLRDDKIASSEHTSATNDWLTMSLSACNNISFLKTRTLCLKTTLMQHTIITKIGWYALMLLRECAIKWWFVIPHLLTDVDACQKYGTIYFITSMAADIIRTVYLYPWPVRWWNIFLLLYMCHSTMGLTKCYKQQSLLRLFANHDRT